MLLPKNFYLKISVLSLLLCTVLSCTSHEVPSVRDGKIVIDGHTEYFIGTNLWYAADLATTDDGKSRLDEELEFLRSCGMRNLRIKATEDTDADALEYVLQILQKKGMYAVLYLNNAWEWSTGFSHYLESAGAGKQPDPSTDGYQAYMNAMSAFCRNKTAIEANRRHIASVVGRLKDYKSIFSWQICNEPRAFATDAQTRDAFVDYIHSTASFIKTLDPVHLVSTGNEGIMGCEGSRELYYRINDCPDIDYITVHIWPYNWRWVNEGNLTSKADAAVKEASRYLAECLEVAKEMRKSVVVEEFGYPRDGFSFSKSSGTSARDSFYRSIFEALTESAANNGFLAGCNFWAWGGVANPAHERWQQGDDLCGDPAQEQQGLNSVFSSDSTTVSLVKEYAGKLSSMVRVAAEPSDGWLFTGKERSLVFRTYNPAKAQASLSVAFVSDTTLMKERQDTAAYMTISVPSGAAKVNFNAEGLAPGFYQVRAELYCNGVKTAYPAFNIGVEPEKIVSPQDKPEDFDRFWEETFSELSEIPLNARLTPVPEHSNDLRVTYLVEYTSLDGATAGGILCVPVAEGRYPVHIEYMGYGGDTFWFHPSASPQTIDYLVSVRDQGLFKAGQDRWIDRGIESKETFYYRGAFCDVKRALDFIFSLDKTDPEMVTVRGESQGGAFTMLAAAVDERVILALPSVPFMGDFEDYRKIVWWPVWEVMETAREKGLDEAEVLRMMRYFDLKNFADRIKCPVLMAFGLQDDVCPPHTNFSIWNQIKSEKEYVFVPTCGHGMWKEKVWKEKREAKILEVEGKIKK